MRYIGTVAVVFSLFCVEARGAIFAPLPEDGDQIQFKFVNYEPLLQGVPGEELFGVGFVTTVINETLGATVDLLDPGDEITFVFNNYQLLTNTPSPTGNQLDFTGGNVQVYFDESPDVTAAGNEVPAGTNADPDATAGDDFSDGELILEFAGQAGFFLNPLVTLSAQIQNLNTDDFTGEGSGYLSIVGGTLADMFDSNRFVSGIGTTADATFRSTLQLSNAPAGNYPVLSNDPLEITFVVQEGIIPEPSQLLVWAGLLPIGALFCVVRRRRKGG